MATDAPRPQQLLDQALPSPAWTVPPPCPCPQVRPPPMSGEQTGAAGKQGALGGSNPAYPPRIHSVPTRSQNTKHPLKARGDHDSWTVSSGRPRLRNAGHVAADPGSRRRRPAPYLAPRVPGSAGSKAARQGWEEGGQQSCCGRTRPPHYPSSSHRPVDQAGWAVGAAGGPGRCRRRALPSLPGDTSVTINRGRQAADGNF